MTQKHRENFYRTSTVIVEHGKEVLVLLLEDDLSKRNMTLIDFININQHAIYHLCYNKYPCCQCTGGAPPRNTPSQRVLYPSQLDILFDKTGPKTTGHNLNSRSQFCCSSAKLSLTTTCMDLTLLRCLLINFVPSCTGVVRQDVEDLIKHRNNLHGHSQEGKISDVDYSRYKTQIESVILSIAKKCNKEIIIRQKLKDAAVRAMDDTICTQYQNTLLDEIRREKDTKEIIGNMQGVIEQLAEKLKHVEAMAKDIHWRGRNILEKLLVSICFLGCCLTFYYVEFGEFICMMIITFILYCFLLYYVSKNCAIFISSGPLIFVVNSYNPKIYETLSAFTVLCFNFLYSVYSFLVTRYEALPVLFLMYYVILFQAWFKIRKFSIPVRVTICVFPFCFGILTYFWPHISLAIFNNFKAVIAFTIGLVGLKYFIW